MAAAMTMHRSRASSPLLKRERKRRRTYPTREAGKADVFDYIERFYNRRRRHTYLDYFSPVDFENRAMRA